MTWHATSSLLDMIRALIVAAVVLLAIGNMDQRQISSGGSRVQRRYLISNRPLEVMEDRSLPSITSYARSLQPSADFHLNRSDYIFDRHCWDCAPIVVAEYKLVFFAVPKVGCTVFKQLFRRIKGFDDWQEQRFPSIPHDPKRNGLNYLYHFRDSDVLEMMTSPEWTRAIFARDPKERLLSAFLDKGLRSKGGHVRAKCCTGNLAGHEICRTERITSFESFVDVVESCQDVHWSPQAKRLEDKYWPYINFVGHLENVAADTRSMLKKIGAWDAYGASGWGINHNESIFESVSLRNHATRANLKMKKFYTPQLEARVERLYAMDYAHPVLNLRLNRIYEDL